MVFSPNKTYLAARLWHTITYHPFHYTLYLLLLLNQLTNCFYLSSLFRCPVGFLEVSGVCVPACETEPCLNGGACIELEDGYECECQSGYTGDNCEVISEPYVKPALHISTGALVAIFICFLFVLSKYVYIVHVTNLSGGIRQNYNPLVLKPFLKMQSIVFFVLLYIENQGQRSRGDRGDNPPIFEPMMKKYIVVEIYHSILLLGSEKFSTKIVDLCPLECTKSGLCPWTPTGGPMYTGLSLIWNVGILNRLILNVSQLNSLSANEDGFRFMRRSLILNNK